MTNTTQRDEELETLPLRMYRKQELAMCYFPDLSKEAAERNLRRWIKRCSELYQGLLDTGYDKNRKFFLRHEVKMIVDYLGEP